jgi:hypothetical protein
MSSLFRPPTTPAQHRYVAFLRRCDPPADALAAAMAAGEVSRTALEAMLADGPATGALADFRDALTPPLWVDPERQRIGCAALQRTGVLGGLVLALYSLPLGYLSPAGVKPLALSGRFVQQAPRRLFETNRFLVEVTSPGGMQPGRSGFRITAQVRLMHAVVRARLADRWDDAWGAPISQAHMAGTNLLFSLHALDGLRRLGVRFSAAEIDGYLHLWRHIGHTIGLEDELLCATEADARQLWGVVRAIEGEPDGDCRALAVALVGEAVPRALSALLPISLSDPRAVKLIFRLSTALLGRETAERLGYAPQPGPLLVAPLLRALVGGVESVRAATPFSDAVLRSLGAHLNHRLADAALGAEPAEFVA